MAGENIQKVKYGKIKLELHAGVPLPFGANEVAGGINFSLFSKSATAVALVFFAPGEQDPLFEVKFDPQQNRSGHVWHILLKGLPREFRYGYRVAGPYDPEEGNFFDEKNILIDPYARAVSGGAVWGKQAVRKGGSTHPFRYLRRCFLPDEEFDWQGDKPINRPLTETVIYELHVRGYTIDKSSGVAHPGTFRGLIEKIPYLQDLGVTAVELMPVHEFDESGNPFFNPETGERLTKYWGYNPFAFFAPKAAYAADGVDGNQVREFKEMVRELHKAGIEVVLDVVFNHTGEGGEGGPTFCFRGLENNIYYMMTDKGEYKNYSGCGNTVNCNHPLVRQFIIDCLRYWVVEMHVDGFRFDLASVLGRDQDGNVMQNPPILEEIACDPVLAETKIIAEAWDAAGLYQVGSFPAWGRWAEWNGRYRDDMRRFFRGDMGVVGAFATRLTGSSDLYHSSGRHPYHSINFITSHDGFTLNDLVSYNSKHNHANGEHSRDGDNNNLSYNWGYEGETDDPKIGRRRIVQIKNMLASLFLSQGTPMLLAGDEFRRTQNGNNNAYCQDNQISWVNWDLLEKNREIFRFCKEMIRFRKALPALGRERFFTGKKDGVLGVEDISWHGKEAFEPDFSERSRAIAALISGASGEKDGKESYIFIAANMDIRASRFEIPRLPVDVAWRLKIDTAAPAPCDFFDDGSEPLVRDRWLFLRSGSIKVLFAER